MATVLEDGSFRIEWRGGKTFNVYALDREVHVFSSDYGKPTLTDEQAREFARTWWQGGGKANTQEMIRENS